MTNYFRRNTGLAVAVLFTIAAKLNAGVIYNNSVNDLSTRFNPGTTEVGDEILLSTTDPSRYLQTFSFEYYGTNTANALSFAGANVTAQVKFYLNNSPTLFNGYSTPGTVLFDSGAFTITPTPLGRATLNFSVGLDFPVGGIFLGPGPGGSMLTNMTWSVKFSGMGATDEVGLDIYSPPVIGGNYSDGWVNNAGTWMLQTNTVPLNFAATATATPEPSALALSVFGGVALFGIRRWISQSKQARS
jgi:hypothetical protein